MQWAVSLIKLGDYLGHPQFPNINQPDKATEQYRAALPVVAAFPARMRAMQLRYTGLAHERLGAMAKLRGQLDEALAHYRDSHTARLAWTEAEPGHAGAKRDLANGIMNIQTILYTRGDYGAAMREQRRAATIYDDLLRADPDNVQAMRSVAASHDNLANLLLLQGDRAAAVRQSQAALALYERLLARTPDNVQSGVSVRHARENLAQIQRGRPAEPTARP